MLRFFGLILVYISLSCCNSYHSGENEKGHRKMHATLPFDPGAQLIYTKHAKCRMDCRHITDREIHEILDSGDLNDDKSEPEAKPDPKWAIDGYTSEQQHLRVVIATEDNKLIVITCIELGVAWECHCN
jgi:Domain of unknown function (DUF4258)